MRRAEFFRKGGAARDLVRGKRWLLRDELAPPGPWEAASAERTVCSEPAHSQSLSPKESLSQLWRYTYERAMLRYLQSWIDPLRWQRLKPMEVSWNSAISLAARGSLGFQYRPAVKTIKGRSPKFPALLAA